MWRDPREWSFDPLSLIGATAKLGNNFIDLACGNGEGSVAHGPGDVDTDNFAFQSDQG